MSSPSPRFVIAVFGGDTSQEAADFAKALGAAIASAGHIVLTGGKGPPGAVKQEAIDGAANAGGVWVEVRQEPPSIGFQSDSRHAVIETDLGHKRNYLEACICDAAIALDGKAGTRSEVTFSLALGKPVLLVGAQWRKTYPLKDATPAVLNGFVTEAFKRMAEKPSSTALDEILTQPAILEGLGTLPLYAYTTLPAADQMAQAAAACVTQLLGMLSASSPSNGFGFPEVPEYADVRTKFLKWLEPV